MEGAAALDHQIAQPFVARAGEERAAEVALAVRRVHPQLADLVAPLFEQAEAGGAFDRQPVLRLFVGDEAVGEPLGDDDVVVRREGEIAQRRAQQAAAREDEVEIVAVAVREVDRVGLVGVEDGEDDVVVEQQRHARVDGGASPSRQLLRAVVPAGQRVRSRRRCRRGSPSRARRCTGTLGWGRSRWYMMVYGPSNPPRVRHSSWRRRPPSSRSAVCALSGTTPATMRSSIEPPSGFRYLRARLLPFDRLEQGTEVSGAEPLVPLALDDLEEERPGLGIVVAAGRLLEEDLQQVLVGLAAVDQDLQLAQEVDALVDGADADLAEPLRQDVVVAPRRRHELHAGGAQPAHGADDVAHRQGGVLDPVAAVVLGEEVDLRLLEERAERLVVGELHARGRIPHDDRFQTRAVLSLLRAGHVLGVERDLPQLLEAEHVLHPEQRRLHGLEVGGQVIDPLEAEPVAGRAGARRSRRGRAGHETREEPRVPAPLDEAEGGVAERRGDGEHRQRAAVVGEALHVGDERAAPLVEQPEASGQSPRRRARPSRPLRGACAGSARRAPLRRPVRG